MLQPRKGLLWVVTVTWILWVIVYFWLDDKRQQQMRYDLPVDSLWLGLWARPAKVVAVSWFIIVAGLWMWHLLADRGTHGESP